MPFSLADVIDRTRSAGLEVDEQEVVSFVRQSWVLARQSGEDWHFDDADAARVKLIVELKRDLDVNDEAIPLILNLLDQLYGVRQVLEDVRVAVDALPPSLRRELEQHLARVPRQ
ncbi:chaperone modulator CbpM [Aquibaculum sediminis]|uniref:chaperone modulator CbpM n=1 Tax=Aquibaculum sediminis TaxID=3231907 RepID=UPI0034545E04